MKEYEKWLLIANEDLQAAEALLRVELYGSVLYHCQQCAEKSLKSFLIFNKQEIFKTHDLVLLVKKCLFFDSNFSELYEISYILNPLATRFRYPSEFEVPNKSDAINAINKAKIVFIFIKSKIDILNQELKLN